MRVLLALDAVEFAGAERWAEVLLAGLREQGLELLVAVPAAADPQLVERLGAQAELVSVPGLGRRPDPRGALALRRVVRAFRPQLVHLSLTDQGDGLALVAASSWAGVPVALTLHNAIPGRAAWREQVASAVLRRPALVLAVSSAVAAYARSCGARTAVLHNGLAPTPQHPQPRRALGLPEGGHVVGGVGRLHEQKGWDVLAAAATRLTARSDTRVVVVGEGDLRPRSSGPGGGGLELLGGRPDAAALMSAFTVLAIPSRYEAFGLVAVEAMHAGVPVVASAVGGLPEVLGPAGVLVPPLDPDALHDALAALLDDPARRHELAAAGRERAARSFTPEAMVAATLRAYAELLGGAARA